MPHTFSVLIVEDDEDARQNMVDILSLDGYKTKTASRCLTAISALESETFDAVIVDWQLPDENADQLIPFIVKNQPNAPVVVVTGMRNVDTAVTALRSGAYDYLLKPINPDALRSVLRRMVERKENRMALEEAQNRLLINERLAAIGQMVTGLAHESRNAFQRSHACLAELALDLDDKPESLELVRKVQKALDDLHLLLEEVRDYSAPIILERRKCSLDSLVRETWQHVQSTQKLKAPNLTIECEPDFPEICFVDQARIQQVVRNLLENAHFACADPGEITVRLSSVNGTKPHLKIQVSDDGEGIPEGAAESIFAPFFTTKTKGTGLGLAVSRRYVDAHGGRIFADRAESGGARFTVEIPIQKN